MCIYAGNPLQIAVLNLFLSLRYRFPNLVVGAVTRESIKSALSNGITADQVIMYLHTHAHPQMRKLEPLLPPTVVDQIRLWELEKNRIRAQDGQLEEFFSRALFFITACAPYPPREGNSSHSFIVWCW
jgi:transcription initiation factor TFIIH subunit 4